MAIVHYNMFKMMHSLKVIEGNIDYYYNQDSLIGISGDYLEQIYYTIREIYQEYRLIV
ncbi:Uncharacterised protein [Yersinia enterocolitica]|nr:Uncharacterised protein [Yersinia enterocolitica]